MIRMQFNIRDKYDEDGHDVDGWLESIPRVGEIVYMPTDRADTHRVGHVVINVEWFPVLTRGYTDSYPTVSLDAAIDDDAPAAPKGGA